MFPVELIPSPPAASTGNTFVEAAVPGGEGMARRGGVFPVEATYGGCSREQELGGLRAWGVQGAGYASVWRPASGGYATVIRAIIWVVEIDG